MCLLLCMQAMESVCLEVATAGPSHGAHVGVPAPAPIQIE